MTNCELCGKDTELFRSDIEGTILNVCKDCSSFGKILSPIKKAELRTIKKEISLPAELEMTEAIVPNFSELVKQAREKRNLKQEDFAKMLNEKASIIHKIETGTLEPPIPLAKKLEKMLGIKLITQVKEELLQQSKAKTDQVTIGDLIKLK